MIRVVSEAVHTDVVGIVERAQQFVVLVSPYLEPWDRLVTELHRAHARSVPIVMISRGGSDQAKRQGQLDALRPLLRYSGLVERLHAKVYLNENEALVSSLNLLGTSALDSIELGIHLQRAAQPEAHDQLRRFCDGLLAKAEQDKLRGATVPTMPAPVRSTTPAPERREAMRRSAKKATRAFCIRCKDAVDLNPDRPLCRSCYSSWAEYENEDYQEKYCHECGRGSATSMRRPLCKTCWAQ